MKKLTTLYVVLTTLFAVTGCASSVKPLQPGAEKVQLTTHKAPKNCQYVGHVKAYDVNGATQSYHSHEHLQQDQVNTLKNQAFNLGANTVVITSHEVTSTTSRQPLMNEHTMIGEAYTCPPSALF